ncbi:hypothetical protein MKW92_019950 [Papaver armeniacum]|nr:hypothetical protein MKW92_019950 [Papaver armeniacum]
MKMGISSTKLVVVLILSLLLIGGFFRKVLRGLRILPPLSYTTIAQLFKCECNSRCIPLGYPRGICVKPIGSFCCCIRNTV